MTETKYIYHVKSSEVDNFMGHFPTRDTAMEYLEICCNAENRRYLSCSVLPSSEAVIDIASVLSNMDDSAECFVVLASGKPIASFSSSSDALEYSTLRSAAGKPCSVAPLNRSMLLNRFAQNVAVPVSAPKSAPKMKTRNFTLVIALFFIVLASCSIAFNLLI